MFALKLNKWLLIVYFNMLTRNIITVNCWASCVDISTGNPVLPILLPGGAVIPAINDTTGLAFSPWLCSCRYSAALSSAPPPISPIRTIPALWHTKKIKKKFGGLFLKHHYDENESQFLRYFVISNESLSF